MWTVGNKRRQEEKEGRKEGRDGGAMGGGDGEPRPYTLAVPRVRHPSISGTLFAHARGIYLKRKSELPLPAHARCTCARHAARTLTRHHLAALSLVLPWYSRLVQIIQTSRESDHECSYETFSFRSPFEFGGELRENVTWVYRTNGGVSKRVNSEFDPIFLSLVRWTFESV